MTCALRRILYNRQWRHGNALAADATKNVEALADQSAAVAAPVALAP